MELALGLAILLAFNWVIAVVLILLAGNLFELSIPGWGGMFWRAAVLGAASIGGVFLSGLVPVPLAGIVVPVIVVGFAASILFEFDLPEDLGVAVGFAIAYGLAQFMGLMLLAGLLQGMLGE